MSNLTTDFASFTVTDYQGSTEALSSYNLSITPLTFTPEIPSILGKNSRVAWDFGNGDKSSATNPTYYYKVPGLYTIKLYIYNSYNQAVQATTTREVTIKNYIPDTFNVTTSNDRLTSFNGVPVALNITQSLPYNYSSSTISYNTSGTDTTKYFDLDVSKYNHLEQSNTLLKKEYIPSLNTYEFTEVDSISLTLTAIYAKLVDDTIVTSLSSDNTTIIAGYSGVDVYYYKDDLPTSRFNLSFSKSRYNYLNPLNISMSGVIYPNVDVDSLSITSNGLDGEGYQLSAFNIGFNKFAHTVIPFTVKIKDSNFYTNKNFGFITPTITLTNVSPSSYTVTSLQSALSDLSVGGVYYGCFELTDTITEPITGVQVSATIASVTDLDSNVYTSLTGASNTFNIYPQDYYQLFKHGEDFDSESMFKSLIFQETMMNKDVLFEDFLGTIFGTASADTEALGKKVYERIYNFINNTVNIDTAEINRVISLGDLVDFKSTIFDKSLTNFPNKVQRLASLLSLNKYKLFGEKNKFVENFADYGTLTKDIYGKNLGDKINPFTYVVKTSANIVAYEKFSRTYKLLNTYQPLSARCAPYYYYDNFITETYELNPDFLTEDEFEVTTQGSENILFTLILEDDVLTEGEEEVVFEFEDCFNRATGQLILNELNIPMISDTAQLILGNIGGYYIADYDVGWGWPLVLPTNFTQADIDTFYDFYEFTDVYAGNIVGGALDFDQTTVDFDTPYATLYGNHGIFENIILDTLYQSLSLIKYT